MGERMTAADVRACLATRWPDSEYLHIPEAPEQSDRGGRKLDLLVVSLWRSRGLELDGVEIKVSVSDWRRELANAAKADWWWRHVHRFWVAVPASIADTVKAELPETWGLLACEAGKTTKVAVKAPKHTAEPLSWERCVGLLRAASDCGRNALHRAEVRGFADGKKAGLAEAERLTSDGHARQELDVLRQRVAAFEAASGLNISRGWHDETRIGELVATIERERAEPGWILRSLANNAEAAIRAAEQYARNAAEMKRAAETIAKVVGDVRKDQAA